MEVAVEITLDNGTVLRWERELSSESEANRAARKLQDAVEGVIGAVDTAIVAPSF